MKKALPVIAASVVVLGIVAALELLILSFFYAGIPTPFPETEKPVGGVLLPVTFFHLLLAVPSLLAILYAAKKAGYNVGKAFPQTRQAWTEILFLLVLFASGILVWWYALALLPFVIAGIYLVFVELR